QAGTWAEAAGFGDVVLLAVRAEGVPGVLQAVDVAGKVVVDCTNSIVQGEWTLATPAMAEWVAAESGARVVKAFHLCPDATWRMTPPPVHVPLCGDDPDALAMVRQLVADIGCAPLDGGGLGRAVLFEAAAAVEIGLTMTGHGLGACLTR
ncbi:NADPH-dependent F420 reductase, partial [Kibdelosporangium lantanae]